MRHLTSFIYKKSSRSRHITAIDHADLTKILMPSNIFLQDLVRYWRDPHFLLTNPNNICLPPEHPQMGVNNCWANLCLHQPHNDQS